MSIPPPSTPPPDGCCLSFWKNCCCQDCSQPVHAANLVVSTTGLGIGIATGNVPLTVISAVGMTASATGQSRMYCVGDRIRLSHTADSLQSSIKSLTADKIALTARVNELQADLANLQGNLQAKERQLKESSDQLAQASQQIRQISEQSDDLKKQYEAAHNACNNLKETLAKSQQDQSVAIASIRSQIHEDEGKEEESVSLLSRQVTDLIADKDKAIANLRMQNLLAEFQSREKDLAEQIGTRDTQITALQGLKTTLEGEIKTAMDQITTQMTREKELQDQLAEFKRRLQPDQPNQPNQPA